MDWKWNTFRSDFFFLFIERDHKLFAHFPFSSHLAYLPCQYQAARNSTHRSRKRRENYWELFRKHLQALWHQEAERCRRSSGRLPCTSGRSPAPATSVAVRDGGEGWIKKENKVNKQPSNQRECSGVTVCSISDLYRHSPLSQWVHRQPPGHWVPSQSPPSFLRGHRRRIMIKNYFKKTELLWWVDGILRGRHLLSISSTQYLLLRCFCLELNQLFLPIDICYVAPHCYIVSVELNCS